MTDLARLVVKLTAQTAEYEKKLDQANSKLSRFQKSTDSQLSQISRSFGTFNRALGAIGVGVSFVAITRGLAGAAQRAIEYGDAINKASIKTGVGAEAFSELAYAAKQNDIELSALETGFKKLQVAISEAGSGSKSAQATFAALGIEFKRFRALAPEKQFEVIAEQISRIKDPADKARAATELFGRAGADLLPMFEKGAEGIRKAREEAQRLGASLSQEQVEKLAAADDAIKRLSSSWGGFARTLTASVAPALTKVFDILSNADAGAADLSRRSQIDALLKSRGNQADLYQDTPGLRRELAQIDYRERQRLLGPGRQARRSMPALAKPPGFKPPAPGGGSGAGPSAAQIAGLSEIAVTAQRISVGAMAQLYADMDKATQTALEQQLAEWESFDSQVQELIQAGYISAAEGTRRILENNEQILEPVTITAEKIFPPAEQERLSEFWLQASRNTQDILAEFIFDPFSQGLDEWAEDFGRMLQRMAAEAIAADIAGKIFGTGGMGSGGGWLGQLAGFAGSLLGGMGGGKLTPITVTAQRIPGYADGGFLRPGQIGMVGERGPELAFGGRHGMTIEPNGARSGVVVQNHFTIQAPAGSVSRATEMQIAAAAARGAARANQRNN